MMSFFCGPWLNMVQQDPTIDVKHGDVKVQPHSSLTTPLSWHVISYKKALLSHDLIHIIGTMWKISRRILDWTTLLALLGPWRTFYHILQWQSRTLRFGEDDLRGSFYQIASLSELDTRFGEGDLNFLCLFLYLDAISCSPSPSEAGGNSSELENGPALPSCAKKEELAPLCNSPEYSSRLTYYLKLNASPASLTR